MAKCISREVGNGKIRLYRISDAHARSLPTGSFKFTTKSRVRRARKKEARLEFWTKIGERQPKTHLSK